MIDYSIVLTIFYSDKQWSISGNRYEDLDWLDESPKPTKEELADLWAQAERQQFNTEQKQKRRLAYIAEADSLWFEVQRGEATKDDWLAKVNEIKGRFPFRD